MAATPSASGLRRLLGLRPGEGRRTAVAGLFHVAFVAAVVLVKSASGALVVARYEASALPPLYMATALTTGLGAWLAGHLPPARGLPRLGLLGAAIVAAALGAGVWLSVPGAVTALYLFGEAFATLTSIRFWGAASELFDPREGRRIFGILGGAGMAGAIVGGLVAQLLAAPLGAIGLMPLAAGAMIVAALAGLFAGKAPRPPGRPEGGKPKAASPARVRGYLLGDPYPRTLALLMLLLAALTAVADYLFRVRAAGLLSEAELASLFGALNLWMGVSAVVFQIAIAGRTLERFGVFRYLLVTPLGSAAAAVACLFVPGIWPAFGLRLVESAGSLSLNPAAFQLLYGPVPDALRPGVRSAIDGLVKKAGFAAGGALLLAIPVAAGVEVLVGLLLAVVGLFALQLGRSRALYVDAIERRIGGPSARAELGLAEAEARAVLVAGLGSSEPRRVLQSLGLLEGDVRFDARRRLPRLLEHPDERVRVAAVRAVARRGVLGVTDALLRILGTDTRRPRDEAALALATVAPARAQNVLAPLLSSADPGLSAVAIAALLPLEPPGGPASRALEARLASLPRATPGERRETARLLGRLGPGPHVPHLAPLLADADPSVRRLACEAAEALAEPSLVGALLERLGDRAARAQARAALARQGDAVVPTLAAVLDDRSVPTPVRLEVPRVLRAIGTEAAAHALLFSNIQDDPYLRYRIAVSLSRLHEEHPEVALEPTRIREATRRRVDAYAYYLPLYRDLEHALPPGSILVRALGDRLDQNLEMVFRLVQLVAPRRSVLAAWRRFAGGDARERAYAVELLEHLLDDELRRKVVPLLERFHRLPEAWGGVAAEPERAPARLLELMVSKDPVLRACSIHTARRLAPAVHGFPFGDAEEGYMSQQVIEKVFFLEGVEIFGHSDVDDLAALAAIAREREFHGGDHIFREGDPGDSLFVILEGRVRFEKAGAEMFSLGERDAFGETSLLDGAPRPVHAVAETEEVRVLAIDRQDFLDLVADRPELLKGIFAAVTKHLKMALETAAAARLSAPRAPAAAAEPTPSVAAGPVGTVR